MADLEAFCSDKDISGHVGIAHTRWATHGEPSAVNAHPHYSSSKNLAMIHNGIIENYADIKKNLIAKGVEFKSETDTEVLVQLIEYIQVKKDLDLLTAVQVALRQVIGAYAIAILDKRNPNQIIAARKQSPLVVGIGKDGEFYLGSDASPIISVSFLQVVSSPSVITRVSTVRLTTRPRIQLRRHSGCSKISFSMK